MKGYPAKFHVELWSIKPIDFKCVVRFDEYFRDVYAHKDEVEKYNNELIRGAYQDWNGNCFGWRVLKLTRRELLALYEDFLTEQMSLF